MENVKITLNKLRMENFKGFERLELDFGGRNASLYGDNAVGKTTVYDAFVWLLFGKDSRGQKDFDIKPLDGSGQVKDHAAITVVEAVLLVNGTERTLRRTYYEKWSTRRGSTEAVIDCHSSDYAIDGVPLKKNEFDRQVAELVDEETFRLLTMVSWFPEMMSWQSRREVLFRLAGVGSDADILATDPRFDELGAAIGSGGLDGYRKRLKAERGGLNTNRTDIPARISENQERLQTLRRIPFGELRQQREVKAAQKGALEQELSMIGSNTLLGDKRNQLAAVKNDLRALENENTAHRRSQEVPDDTGRLRDALEFENRKLRSLRSCAERLKAEEAALEQGVENCRNEWSRWNSMTFSGAVCPTCGQSLTGAALDAARREFCDRRETGKREAVDRSHSQKARLEEIRKEIAENQEQILKAEAQCKELEDRLKEATAAVRPEISDLPGYAARRQELMEVCDSLNNQIFNLESDKAAEVGSRRREIQRLEGELRELDGELAKEALMTDIAARVEDLRDQAQTITDRMNELDRMLSLCDEFTRYKVSFVEDTVNSLFSMAQFRLYREQINGGLEDRCDVTYRGVPYTSLNNGARINVGLDIIRTISREQGISVPLFVDNAESVTELTPMETQVIRLAVSKDDKKLRCEYED